MADEVKEVEISNAGMQISLFSEFDQPMSALFAKAIHRFAEIEAPVIGLIPRGTVDHIPLPSDIGRGRWIEPTKISAEGSTYFDDILNLNVEAWSILANDIGVQYGRGMMRHLVETMNKVTQETGNVVSGKGQPLSHDVFLDMLEKMEFEVDDDGQPKHLVLLVHPDTRKSIASLPPMTPEQESRYHSIINAKREAQDAKRRTRKMG